MIDTSLFPYQNHPYRLEFGEGKNITVCFFECDHHLQKYISRAKLKRKEIKILHRDEKLINPIEKNQKKVRQGTTKTSRGSSGTNRRNTKDLDTSGTAGNTNKPTKK